ncbi:transposase [Shigella flexneri K-227]|uniref:Transposase n=4 Tax=Shigella TaxID=620 RepID=F5NVM1_SHIFL|nr:transposase [Shigella flexneri K-272]EGK37565.1 transposase [Shigella flexneri K-227]
MPCFTAMRAEIALMSGSAFAVTHHAFSSGAGRTSDGNGSHASTLKSPSYTKSVSWQHYQKYPRKSRTTEFLFLILFIVLMTPISPLIFVWIIGKIIEPVIELYNDVVWASFNTLHNKINPYKES